jgi:thiol-disulfide isomerase/thioredoxin
MIFKNDFLKKISLSVLLFSAASAAAIAGNLTISPEKPTVNSQIQLSYEPHQNFKSDGVIRAFVYTFTETRSVPKGDEVLLTFEPKAKVFKGLYSLEKDVVYGLLKVVGASEVDNNKETFWDFLVYDASGKPVRGAQMRAGVSYLGNLPTQAKRNVNTTRALEFIQGEANLYPDNVQAKIGALSLRFENKEIEKAVFDDELRKIVSSNFDKTKESDVRSVTRALTMLAEHQRATELEQQYLAANPQSELAEELALSRLSSVRSQEDFLSNGVNFVNNFPASVYTERVLSAMLNVYLKNEDIAEASRVLNSLKRVPASAYNQIAFTFAEKDSALEQALEWNTKALKKAEMPNLDSKPVFVTNTEWAEASRQTEGAVLFTRGAILNKLGRSAEAMEAFSKAQQNLGDNAPVELYSALVQVQQEQGKTVEAYQTATDALRKSKSNEEITTRHKELFEKLNAGSKNYNKVIESLSEEASKSRRSKIATEKMMIPMPLPNEKMSTMDGKEISLADMKGKVVILDFWATWCGPCRQSFPAMQKLYEKYKNNPNVAFAIVDVWEREKDRKATVKAYLDKNPNLTFPVYFDEDDAIVKSLGVTGIPTKFYLDKAGIVQFKEVGFAGEEGFLRDAEDKIEVLLNEG